MADLARQLEQLTRAADLTAGRIPAELTAARTKAGMSQAALARAIGYSKRTIQRYEAGDWPIPQVFALAVAAVSQPTTKRGGPKR